MITNWHNYKTTPPPLNTNVLLVVKDWYDGMIMCVASFELIHGSPFWSVQGATGYDIETSFVDTDIKFWTELPKLPKEV